MQELVISYLTAGNVFLNDFILFKIASKLPSQLLSSFEEVGAFVSSKEAQDLARMANKNPPNLYLKTDYGTEIQSVELHPSYHALLRRSKHIGLISSLWDADNSEAAVRYQARAIRLFLMGGLENGHLDEVVQTNAGIAALLHQKELYQMLTPYLLSRQHDVSERQISAKKAITISIAIDNSSSVGGKSYNFAKQLNTDDELLINNYIINAHQCIIPNPNADLFIVLAELAGSLCCFLVPKFNMDGRLNNVKVNYLIPSSGYRSRPLAKMNFDNSVAWMIGQVGEGGRIFNSLELIRQFDQLFISCSTMYNSLQYVIDNMRYKEQHMGRSFPPLTKRICADIALDIAAAKSLAFRIAQAFDLSQQDEVEAAFARVMVPAASFWINSLVSPIINELIAHLGIENYHDNSILVRAMHDAPVRLLNTQSVNNVVLDVISSINRGGDKLEKIYQRIAQDSSNIGPKVIELLRAATKLAISDESVGRILLEQLAYCVACSALQNTESAVICNAFAESRLGGQKGASYGTLNVRYSPEEILNILHPVI